MRHGGVVESGRRVEDHTHLAETAPWRAAPRARTRQARMLATRPNPVVDRAPISISETVEVHTQPRPKQAAEWGPVQRAIQFRHLVKYF